MSDDPNLPRVTSTSSDKLASVHDVHEAQNGTKLSIQGAVAELLSGIFSRNAVLLLAVIISVVIGTLWTAKAFGQSIAEKVDAGQHAQDVEIQSIERRFDQHVVDSGAAHAQFRQDLQAVNAKLDEQALELRALYRANRTGQREPRLERPPLDAGGVP